MRVALLAHCRHPIAEPFAGGLERHTALLADGLVARGHEVTLFAKEGSRTRARLYPVVPAHLHPEPKRPGRPHPDLPFDAALRRALAHLGEVDVVVNNSLSPVPYTDLGGRTVFTVLHTPATNERVLDVLGDPAWRPGARHAWAAVSTVTGRDWAPVLPGVAVVPNGIELARWRPRRRGARLGRPHAVWAGRITPEKGTHLAIAAAERAGWPLRLAGPVSDPEYFAAAVAPRLSARVRYVGHLGRRRLAAFLRGGTVFLFTPLWAEPFGLALVEAMACGTPAAALPHGAVREVLGADGGVVAGGSDAAALADALVRAAGLDRSAVSAAAGRFAHTAMLDAYEDVLARLVAGDDDRAVPVGVPAPAEGDRPCR